MDKPKVNIIPPEDPRGRMRSGVIVITDEQGRSWYKIACDRCQKIVALRVPPAEGKETLCDNCRYVARKAKPSTRVIYVKGKTRYKTRCDACGKEEVTQFIPFNDREFLCNGCHRQRGGESTQTKRPVTDQSKRQADYTLCCHACGKKIRVKFRPDPREQYSCPECYSGRRRPSKQTTTQDHGTRVMFHIECVYCGKKEVLNFVPSDRSAAICSACFEKRKKRRSHPR